MAWFEFKSSVLADVVRVEWPKDSQVAVIDAGTAVAMVRNGYARGLTQAEVDRFNAAVDEFNNSDEETQRRKAEEDAAETARLAAEAETKRLADEAEAKRKADEIDAKKVADAAAAKAAADAAAKPAAAAVAPAAAPIPPVFENAPVKPAAPALTPLDVTKQTGDNGGASAKK